MREGGVRGEGGGRHRVDGPDATLQAAAGDRGEVRYLPDRLGRQHLGGRGREGDEGGRSEG